MNIPVRVLDTAAAVVLAAAIAYPLAHAAPAQTQRLAEMDRTTWTARDGAPQAIRAIAQGPDGKLWLGSEVGLFSFDGHLFAEFKPLPGEPQLPSEPIQSLVFANDGALWVGLFQAGAARIANGRVTLHPKLGDRPLGMVAHLTPAADGSIWAISQQTRLVRFGTDGVWHDEAMPVPGLRIGSFLIDSSNTLWVPQGGRLHRRPLEQDQYTATDIEVDLAFDFAEAQDGSFWMTDILIDVEHGRTQHVDREGRLIATLPSTDLPQAILVADEGSVILARQGDGLRRFSGEDLVGTRISRRSQAPDVVLPAAGRTLDIVHAVLQDTDGNLWAGGRSGLERFRRSILVPFIPDRPGSQWLLCADQGGTVWIGGLTDQLYRLSGSSRVSIPDVDTPYTMHCADNGDLWFVNGAGIWRLRGDRIKSIPYIPGVPPYGVMQVVVTADGTLHATVGGGPGKGIWEYRNGQWTQFVRDGVLGRAGWIQFVGSQERVWMGHRDGIVTVPREGRVLSTGDPGVGTVREITETSRGVFAAGTNGVALLRGESFRMLEFADEAVSRGIWAVVESQGGDLWFNTSRGIVRVARDEFAEALRTPGHRMKFDLVTEGDYAGASPSTGEWAAAARDGDGRLWFATLSGVVSLDPENWRVASRPPTVTIQSVAADRQLLDESATIRPGSRTLEVRYLGVNLTAPEKVTYRYLLDGFDETWREVGGRTEAIYTGLPAGTYIFRVMASNGNGAWTEPVSTGSFTVLPRFYQTTWFAATCVLAALAALWLGYRMRVRTITREVRARAEERADERIRIARELHDTLLQGVQGLLLTFHVAAQKVAADAESKSMLERALAAADRIIIEGRNRVSRLRSENLRDSELVSALENVCHDLMGGDSIQCSVTRHGVPETLIQHVAEEVFYVAREALTNAFRHSDARQISVDLSYGRRRFTLSCKDDGRGFESMGPDRSGHWGIQGMSERVQKLGGTLDCISAPGQGTEIRVSIPSYLAYPRQSRVMYYLRAFLSSDSTPR